MLFFLFFLSSPLLFAKKSSNEAKNIAANTAVQFIRTNVRSKKGDVQ